MKEAVKSVLKKAKNIQLPDIKTTQTSMLEGETALNATQANSLSTPAKPISLKSRKYKLIKNSSA